MMMSMVTSRTTVTPIIDDVAGELRDAVGEGVQGLADLGAHVDAEVGAVGQALQAWRWWRRPGRAMPGSADVRLRSWWTTGGQMSAATSTTTATNPT